MTMKKINKENFRVVVEPKGLGDFGFIRVGDNYFNNTEDEISRKYQKRCDEIIEDIKRHVDNVRNVYMDYDTNETCEFCGYGWEVDKNTGEPLCCQKAIDEFNQNKNNNGKEKS